MGMVDTLMVGHVGTDALASMGMALPFWFLFALFFAGCLQILTPLYSNTMVDDWNSSENFLNSSTFLAWASSGLLVLFVFFSPVLFQLLEQPLDLIPVARNYLLILAFAAPAFFINQNLRQLFEIYQKPMFSFWITLITFFLNFLGNYCFIYGKFGCPAWGVEGSAVSTALCWWISTALHLFFLKQLPLPSHLPTFFFDSKKLHRSFLNSFIQKGVPLGVSHAAEISFFVISAWLVGQFGKVALASHQIAINLAACTFMFAVGTAQATSVLISQVRGSGTYKQAKIYWFATSGLLTITCVMGVFSLFFILFPTFWVSIYTHDVAILELAPSFVMLAGIFQVFDGLQSVGLGILRGIHQTNLAMKYTLVAYWGVGMPLGLLLGKVLWREPQGYWVGFIAGLAVAAALHFWGFKKKLHWVN